MTTAVGHVLVVDDSRVNRMLLTRALAAQGYTSATAENGRQALALLQQAPGAAFDIVLLDIVMPEMDGYQALAAIKDDAALRHIPVIVISAVDEMDSVVRCIELGATDYLPKPFNAALLRARLHASLTDKRLRDLELEYLEQVGHVTAAAAAVENDAFVPESLDNAAARPDALGQLARVFQRMAREVHAREDRLRQQVHQLRIEIDEARQTRQVAEITGSAYFRQLRSQASTLRQIMQEPGGTDLPPDPPRPEMGEGGWGERAGDAQKHGSDQ